MKTECNPMSKTLPPFLSPLSPRCGAKTRAGSPCQGPAMPNGRCRLHGGKSPGAPTGKANGNYRTGHWTKEAVAERRQMARMIREMRREWANTKTELG